MMQTHLTARHFPEPQKPDTALIQLCLILDVSGSMEGLLYQAQTQVWGLMDYVQSFRRRSKETVVEVALITVGNGAMYEGQHYMDLVSPFTPDRNALADQLFLLKIEGSSEQYGKAISLALDSLTWHDKSELKSIIVLGNESFDQGDTDYKEITTEAAKRGILVNTIFCGEETIGIEEHWLHASELGKGAYAYIDQTAHANRETPFDRQIFRLYNKYLLSYGDSSLVRAAKKLKGDQISPAYRDMLFYRLDHQKQEKDIIDRFEESEWDLNRIDPEYIPEALKQLGDRGLKEYLVKKAQERNNARDGLKVYRDKINGYIQVKSSGDSGDKNLKDAVEEILGKQLKAKRFKRAK